MPSVTLELAKLSREQKRTLVSEITETVSKVTGLPAESVYVFVKENDPDNIGVGGRLLSDGQ